MTKDEVIILMLSSTSARQWDANCDKVKAAFGGHYPEWWWADIMVAGVYATAKQNWSSR